MPRCSFLDRRDLLRSLVALGASIACRSLAGATQPSAILTRAIPSSGEALPVVGLGSWITFNVGERSRRPRRLHGRYARFLRRRAAG